MVESLGAKQAERRWECCWGMVLPAPRAPSTFTPCRAIRSDKTQTKEDEDASDQSNGHGVRETAVAGPRRAGGVPHAFRNGAGGPDEERALHAGNRSCPSHPRDGEG